MTARRHLRTAAAGLGCAAVLMGCGGSGSAGTPETAPDPPGSAAAAGSSSSTVTVVETEFHIAMDHRSFRPGTYTFDVKNQGADTHALELTGPGSTDTSTGDIDPGSSRSMTVTLRKGRYDVFCPVGNHKSLGMDTSITVT